MGGNFDFMKKFFSWNRFHVKKNLLGGVVPVVNKCPVGWWWTPGVKLLVFTSRWLATTWAGLSLLMIIPLFDCWGAGCSVILPPSGPGDPSRESDSGVINPDIPAWLGDEGALRLKIFKHLFLGYVLPK